jgi:hypothetical protein
MNVLRVALVGAALAACGSMPAHAQLVIGEQATIVRTVTTSTYLNGGIGADEQATMRRVAKEFPLRIVFSEGKDGAFLADIPMVISDSTGNSILALRAAGPMLYVILPQGRYKVSARFNGVTRAQQVTVSGNQGKELYFHWEVTPRVRDVLEPEQPHATGRIIAAGYAPEEQRTPHDEFREGPTP